MLQTFYELPQRTIERRGHAQFFTAVGNGAIHEINLGLAPGQNVLQHAGFVLAGSIRAFLNEGAGIAVELDAESLGHRFSFGDERVEKRAGGSETRGSAGMKECESADGVCRGVEDELGPLGAAGVLQRNDFQACAVQKLRQLFDARIRSVRWFKRANPRVAVDVKADVAGFDYVTGGKRGASNYVAHVFPENFLVADAVLHRANGAIVAEQVSGLLDCRPRVRAFGGHDSEITGRDFVWIRGRVEARGEISGAADAQATLVDGARMFLRNIVCVNLHIGQAREMGAEDAADGAAADYTDFDAHALFRASSPV